MTNGNGSPFENGAPPQLNVLAPLPVVLRWREIVKNNNGPAWAVLEKAMDALAAQSGDGPERAEGDR